MKYLILLILLSTSIVFGATKSLQGDNWKSSNLSKTWTPSGTAGSLVTAQSVSGDMTAVVSGDLTNFQIRSGGVSLTADVAGILPVANGGTGLSTYTGPTVQRFTSGSGVS